MAKSDVRIVFSYVERQWSKEYKTDEDVGSGWLEHGVNKVNDYPGLATYTPREAVTLVEVAMGNARHATVTMWSDMWRVHMSPLSPQMENYKTDASEEVSCTFEADPRVARALLNIFLPKYKEFKNG